MSEGYPPVFLRHLRACEHDRLWLEASLLAPTKIETWLWLCVAERILRTPHLIVSGVSAFGPGAGTARSRS